MFSMSAQTLSAIPVALALAPSRGLRAFSICFATLFSMLVVLNALVAPQDAGWLSLNATPFLILPVLLGLRHGTLGGCVAGL